MGIRVQLAPARADIVDIVVLTGLARLAVTAALAALVGIRVLTEPTAVLVQVVIADSQVQLAPARADIVDIVVLMAEVAQADIVALVGIRVLTEPTAGLVQVVIADSQVLRVTQEAQAQADLAAIQDLMDQTAQADLVDIRVSVVRQVQQEPRVLRVQADLADIVVRLQATQEPLQ